MKLWGSLKINLVKLALLAELCLFCPYVAALVQRGESTIRATLAPKICFTFAATALVLLCALLIRKKLLRITVTATVWAVLELLVVMEMVMFCMTGHSFDQSFLLTFNANLVTREVVKAFWKPTVCALLVLFALTAAVGYLAGKAERLKPDRRKLSVLWLALLLFFLPGTPGVILTRAVVENIRAATVQRSFADLRNIQAKPGKNLVFIVVESLEQNYLSEEHFPGLIPNLSKWINSPDALVFENMLSASANTFDFLYQSHMGEYIYSITDSDYADRQVSLSQILKTAGYDTAFLKACSLDFASTGTFVKKVKYDRRMDCRDPEVQSQVTELGAWGFRDYELFEVAKNEFKKLAERNRPFVFTLFTVDSHAPTGVIGKRSLSYTLPNGERQSLLSALHTTDAALGKFLEFLKSSPQWKDTVVVISGDHLVMRDVVPGGKSVQSMLEYKKRQNLLTFILNGETHGKVENTCWPVDLAPIILRQMGVTHNAVFPRGVDSVADRTAAPRKKLTYNEYMAQQRKIADRDNGSSDILSRTVRVTGGKDDLTIHLGDLQVKCDPLQDRIGTFMEFHAGTGAPTSWKNYLHRGHVEFFRTNPKDPDLFYMFCSCRDNIFHFIFGEREYRRCFLAAVIDGWYKIDYARKLSDLKLSGLDKTPPRFAEAKIDVSKNIVTLRKGDWAFPLFSKTDTYIPQGAVFAVSDREGRETIRRADFRGKKTETAAVRPGKYGVTVIAPPDSPFHRQYGVPEDKIDQLMRLEVTPSGEKIELVPLRLPGEGYIARIGRGQYVYREEGKKTACRLVGTAPARDFGDGLCYAATFDEKSNRIVAVRSFRESRIAAGMMLDRKTDEKTLLICGRNSEFLKTYYPQLADRNVLFSITPSAIRHAVQYGNGNFRIPDAAEPTDVQCGASVRLSDGVLIVCWGNISFAVPGEVLDSALASGRELAVKLPLHDPKNITFFCVDDPAWLSDILLDFSMDFLLFGGEKCRIPEKLQQKRKAKYFVGISRGAGWELYWSDGIDFRIGRKSAAGAK